MRTSLNEVKEIEAYLDNSLNTSERLLFEARVIIDRSLRRNVASQKKAYAIIQQYYREDLRQRFNQLHEQLFDHPSHAALRKKIINLFKA